MTDAVLGQVAVAVTGPAPRPPRFRADCNRCCGLCCVAPSFEEQQGFGFSKPAHSPCSYLKADFRCGIHSELTVRGFPACRAFDCYGAGQRVTRLFGAQFWKDSPQGSVRMFQAYSLYRALHELLAMLELAVARAAPEARWRLQQRLTWLDGICESGDALSGVAAPDSLRVEVLAEIRAALCGAGAAPQPGAAA